MKKFIVSLVVISISIFTANAKTVAEIAREKANYEVAGIVFMVIIGILFLCVIATVIRLACLNRFGNHK